jgi:hypothetical protein
MPLIYFLLKNFGKNKMADTMNYHIAFLIVYTYTYCAFNGYACLVICWATLLHVYQTVMFKYMNTELI